MSVIEILVDEKSGLLLKQCYCWLLGSPETSQRKTQEKPTIAKIALGGAPE